jgi:O-methyltransferase involved in polyketide biosynthesis
MKPGQESQTAVMVCAARAAAHGRTNVAGFVDPTALTLLPEEARRRIERFRSGARPQGLREKLGFALTRGRAKMMVARTVTIDAAIREAASPQLVILGAGLDGRAWRMPELAMATVFEVDHPDSQRHKQDRLEDALASAGHDPSRPTTWVWEGVVMYLELADIEATLQVVEARSAPGSRLVILYQSPSLVRRAVGFLLSRLGEPFRSAFTQEQMLELLARFGFTVLRDEDLGSIGARLSPELVDKSGVLKAMRIVSAERA